MRLSTRDICLIAVLTAACIGSNYALLGLPNIKVMDLIVFVSGLSFGALVGIITGALSWVVYGTLNPMGFSFPIWISTIIGESIYGFAGGMKRRASSKELEKGSHSFNQSLEMAFWGFILTFIYDLITNIAYALTFGIPVIYALATGWLVPPFFGILHEVSNLLLFLLATVPMVRVINKVKGGERREGSS